MESKRENYVERLLSHRWNGLVKVITGIRRCGKSYLLFKLFKDRLLSEGIDPSDIIEIKLEEIDSISLRNPISLHDYIKSRTADKRKRYVFIDEIQMVPNIRNPYVDGGDDITFYETLNSLLNTGYLDIYITGSNSRMLSSDILTQFRDRGDEFRIHPLSFSEYFSAVGGDRNLAYTDYLTFGGMPRLLTIDSDREKAEYLKGLFTETYLKDIKERHRIDHPEVLEGIIDFISSNIGSLTNPKQIASHFKEVSEGTVRTYIDYLKDAFLFTEAQRFDVKGKKYFSYPNKYYCEDLGLRNARLNFRQQEKTHMMENAIYNELRIRGYSVDVGVVTINTKDSEGRSVRIPKEIDFVANRYEEKVYIQSAFSISDEEKLHSETDQFRYTGDSFRKIVVREDVGKRWFDENGVLHINVVDFMLDKNLI
ncbi:MAG: ATP-binding protein [Candidatus Methanomethylophilaceae archaeon]|nr:ATP-binding protein [Candidatus Methanomethylophilaceae archaeon]